MQKLSWPKEIKESVYSNKCNIIPEKINKEVATYAMVNVTEADFGKFSKFYLRGMNLSKQQNHLQSKTQQGKRNYIIS